MQSAITERFLAKLIAFAGFFTTIFMISGSVTDPVNTPKMLAVGVFGTAAISIVTSTLLRKRIAEHKSLVVLISLFVFFMIISTIFSKAPLTQQLYGSYGRNNGLFTYLFLGMLLLSSICLNSIPSFQSITNGFLFAGILNMGYCIWVIIFGDFVSWYNPYKSPLGTLGNPNFIGAFLGMFFTAVVAIVLNKASTLTKRILCLLALPLVGFEIIKTNAIQGRIVAATGAAVVLFFFIRSRFNNFVLGSYASFIVAGGSLALAGALQTGPLTQYIYKTSISLRGQYWLAGWNAGQSHPFTGVGMDTFGDWYRRVRDPHALELPGVNTVVNAAHNVPIDIFAFGGWPLFATYLMIIALTIISILKVLKRQKSFEVNFVILVSVWIGYQLQSIISINQIGLAIWGWILSGALIGYERFTRGAAQNLGDVEKNSRNAKRFGKEHLPAQVPLFATIGGLIGLLVALPPLTSDTKWMAASKMRSVSALEDALIPSYFNPSNTMKFFQAVQSFEQNNLFDLSRKYAIQAVKWNPDSFDSWKVLYMIKNSTPAEKAEALTNMKRLDPLNPDVTAR